MMSPLQKYIANDAKKFIEKVSLRKDILIIIMTFKFNN